MKRFYLLVIACLAIPVFEFSWHASSRLLVDVTFLEGMFTAILGSALYVASLLSNRARTVQRIGIKLLAVALAIILLTIIVGETLVRHH